MGALLQQGAKGGHPLHGLVGGGAGADGAGADDAGADAELSVIERFVATDPEAPHATLVAPVVQVRAGAAARLIFLSAAQTLLTVRHGFPKS